jgi:copper chaperone
MPRDRPPGAILTCRKITRKGSTVATTTYPVTGMTCGHCVRAVTSELAKLGGVSEVSVGLVPDGASQVRVTSDAPLSGDAIRQALDEAGGYRLAVP